MKKNGAEVTVSSSPLPLKKRKRFNKISVKTALRGVSRSFNAVKNLEGVNESLFFGLNAGLTVTMGVGASILAADVGLGAVMSLSDAHDIRTLSVSALFSVVSAGLFFLPVLGAKCLKEEWSELKECKIKNNDKIISGLCFSLVPSLVFGLAFAASAYIHQPYHSSSKMFPKSLGIIESIQSDQNFSRPEKKKVIHRWHYKP